MSERQFNMVFLVTALLLLGLMAAQVRRGEEASVLSHYTRAATSPLVSSVSWASRSVVGIWRAYFGLVHVRQRRDDLARKVARLKAEHELLGKLYRENRRLRFLLGLHGSSVFPRAVIARVTSFLTSGPARKAVLVDRGRSDEIEAGWVALAQGAVIGRVIDVSRSSAELLLIIDPDSGVAVRHEEERFAGVLRGGNQGPSELVPLEYVPRDAPIAVGDQLVTSGLDGLYPPGLFVGTIRELAEDSPLTWTIRVEVGFRAGELEEVLLIPPIATSSDEEVVP